MQILFIYTMFIFIYIIFLLYFIIIISIIYKKKQ